MRKHRILIVCPDPHGLSLLTSMLRTLGHHIDEAATDRVAVRLMEHNPVSMVLASVDPADADALELLSYVRRKYPAIPVVLMFPRAHVERAKDAFRQGAMAVLKFPVPAAELRAAVVQALEQCTLEPDEAPSPATSPTLAFHAPGAAVRGTSPVVTQAVLATNPAALSNGSAALATAHPQPLVGDMAPRTPFSPLVHEPEVRATPQLTPSNWARELSLVTADPCLRQIAESTASLATQPISVLIVGEPGTGKSLLAQLLHMGGGHPDRPFITLKATDLAESDVDDDDENEAAGPSPEAFRAEWTHKLGQARGGTLYIEEVGALPTEIQVMLLREMQLHDIEAAAGHPRTPSRASVRFVVSTSENLSSAVDQGRFRPELYHRISGFCLMVPPLRHRSGDIELLAEHFRTVFAHEFHKDVVGLTRDAVEALQRHEWPGNVRELKGVIQRAVARCTSPRLTSSHLTPILNLNRQSRNGAAGSSRPHVGTGIRPLKEALEEPEKRIIIQALQAYNWNRQETARVLDINRTTLYKKMKKYGLLVDEPMWVG